MPSQRKKGKKIVGAWVEDDVSNRIDELAKKYNKSKSDIIKAILDEALKHEEQK